MIRLSEPYIKAYQNRDVIYKYRGQAFNFSLSHGLFSSAGIDSGSHLLLKVFSNYIDECIKNRELLPHKILDAGSGIGVLGVCAAAALSDIAGYESGRQKLRFQDRDELARLFSNHNALKNNIPQDIFSAHTEPLLAGDKNSSWDLILSNIPAKAGLPVLEDFVKRSANLLSDKGRAFIVVVNPLAVFFESQLRSQDNNAVLLLCEKGPGHTVFVYKRDLEMSGQALPVISKESFFIDCPAYIRNKSKFEIEKISYNMHTVHGASGFDNPGADILLAAKLTNRLGEKILFSKDEFNILIWSEDQGHFPVWLMAFINDSYVQKDILNAQNDSLYAQNDIRFVLAGRNILGLAMAKYNIASNSDLSSQNPDSIQIISAADIFLDKEHLLEKCKNTGFSLIAYFPESVPGTKRHEDSWESFKSLLESEGIVIISMNSSEAETFDRKKPEAFMRLGDIKRKGFRASAYLKKN